MRNDETAQELLRAKKRWALVNERADREARDRTLEEKLDEVERLMQSIDDFEWRGSLEDDAQVRERWSRLRSKLAHVGASGSKA